MIRHRHVRTAAPGLALAATALLVLGACGSPGSSSDGGAAPSAGASGSAGAATTCDPIPDQQLVVLEDDQHLQTVDNVIPAVNADAAQADPNLLKVLDAVSAKLDTQALISLNKAVDVDRKKSADVAAEWVRSAGIEPGSTGTGSVKIGAADFSESATLGNIYATVLKDAGYSAEVVTIGNREAYLPALEAGDQIQVVPEYVGTLTEFLNKDANGADAPAVASGDLGATVSALTPLGEAAGLVFGDPSQAQDQNAFAVTKAFADEHDLKSLSDLASACTGLVLGAGPECTERPFCQPGLEEKYGLVFSQFKSLDAGGPLTKAALQKGEITLGLVFSSDGSLATS